MKFEEIHKGHNDQIVVFIHGFNFRDSEMSGYYKRCIKSANFKGQAFLGEWPSSGVRLPRFLHNLFRDPRKKIAMKILEEAVAKFISFRTAESQARKEGENLL